MDRSKSHQVGTGRLIIPFVMIYAPEILMIGEPVEIAIVSITALIGCMRWPQLRLGIILQTVPCRSVSSMPWRELCLWCLIR